MDLNSQLPILNGGWNSRNFSFQKLTGKALESFESYAMRPDSEPSRKIAETALKILEYVLRITGHKGINNTIQFASKDFISLQKLWIGAIFSNRFNDHSSNHRSCLATAAMNILTNISDEYGITIIERCFKGKRIYGDGIKWVKKFESANFMPEIECSIRGWKLFNKNDDKLNSIYLDNILNCFGMKFTSGFYQAVQRHAGKRSSCGALARVVNRINAFVGEIDSLTYDHGQAGLTPLTQEGLKDEEYVYDFLWALHDYHFIQYQKNKDQGSLESLAALSDYQRDWKHIINLVSEELIPAKIMVYPLGNSFPEGKPSLARFRDQSNYRKSDGGKLISTKLMTDIPLHVTDEEAMQLLFHRIKNDVETVKTWAKSEIEMIYRRYVNAGILEAKGEVVPLEGAHDLLDRENPSALSNEIRTIRETYKGYLVCNYTTRGKCFCHLFGQTMRAGRVVRKKLKPSFVSHNLGIPTNHDLIIYAIYLIGLHPIFTDAPLLTCDLFNKDGKRTGLQATDSGPTLVVYKGRKGSGQAQQNVNLTAESEIIVNQIIELTDPLRKYLKRNNDDRWRRLFIFTEGKGGFSEPKVFDKASDIKSILRTLNNSRNGRPALTLGNLWNKLTLARMRASVGVLVYLETRSIDKMSEALGNSRQVVLKHYLPETILAFFQERWIRLFQNGIIVHALKDSRFLLESSDFATMEELDGFMRNHAFKNIKDLENQTKKFAMNTEKNKVAAVSIELNSTNIPTDITLSDEILINVEIGTLTLLMGIKAAVNNACGKKIRSEALFWSKLGYEVEKYIESDDFRDPFIRKILIEAKQVQNDKTLDFIYA